MLRWLADLVQKLATVCIFIALGSILITTLGEPTLDTSIKVALVSGLGVLGAAVAAAIMGPRRAADISAEVTRQIAEINAANAREIEKIKAQAALDLEREKEHRQWRRELAKPLLDRLIERQRLWTKLEMAYGDPQATESILKQINDLGGYEWSALQVFAPGEVSRRLQALSEADGSALYYMEQLLEWRKRGSPADEHPERKPDMYKPTQEEAQRNALRALENYIYFGWDPGD